MIQNMEQEIGNGVYRALTCDVFGAIEANQPNMLILNYKQADELQKALVKHHCPDLLKDGTVPVHVNEVSEKEKIHGMFNYQVMKVGRYRWRNGWK